MHWISTCRCIASSNRYSQDPGFSWHNATSRAMCFAWFHFVGVCFYRRIFANLLLFKFFWQTSAPREKLICGADAWNSLSYFLVGMDSLVLPIVFSLSWFVKPSVSLFGSDWT